MQLNELALCKSMACGLHSPLSKQGSPQAVRRAARSLERDEARGVGGSDAGLAVLHGLVADRELCQVVAHHVGLDLDLGATHTAPGTLALSCSLQEPASRCYDGCGHPGTALHLCMPKATPSCSSYSQQ